MSNRLEARISADLTVRVFGMGADGHPFIQNVRAHNISTKGALLIGVEHILTAGDLIGVKYGDKKARCRVVWLIDAGPRQKLQLGVQLLEDQECPWKEELSSSLSAMGSRYAPRADF